MKCVIIVTDNEPRKVNEKTEVIESFDSMDDAFNFAKSRLGNKNWHVCPVKDKRGY